MKTYHGEDAVAPGAPQVPIGPRDAPVLLTLHETVKDSDRAGHDLLLEVRYDDPALFVLYEFQLLLPRLVCIRREKVSQGLVVDLEVGYP